MNRTLAQLLLCAPLSLALVVGGCDDKSKTTPPEKTDKVEKNAVSDKSDKTDKTAGKADDMAKPKIGGAVKGDDDGTPAVALVSRDLAERGAEWKGVSVDGPKDAKIWDDMGDCRVVTKEFDLVLSQKKEKSTIAARKKSLEDLAKQLKGKVTFDSETPSLLEYTLDTPKYDDPTKMDSKKSWFSSIKVGKKDIGCMPHDSADKDTYEMLKKACTTVGATK